MAGERGVEVIAVGADPVQWLAGPSAWVRVARRTRLGIVAAVGTAGGEAAGRGEVALHFLLDPRALRGVAWYAGSGLAAGVGAAEGVRLVAVVGAEHRPGARHGWFVEGGVGGGIRVAVGWRWRTLARPASRR